MCGDLSDRDDFDPPPRRPDLWRERQADTTDDDVITEGSGDKASTDTPAGDVTGASSP